MRSLTIRATVFTGLALVTLLEAGCASTGLPAVTDDGLVRVARTSLDAVYTRPGVELPAFQRLVVEPCSVRMREHWLRDQNRDRGPSELVTAADVERIEQRLAASCHEIFASRLEGVVGEGAGKPGEARVLAVRPAIVDLDVIAPDVQAPGRRTRYTTNAVRMSLRVELVDAATGATVGRMIDHRRSETFASPRPTSGAGNLAEAERILATWAAEVREQLEPAAD